VLPVDVQPAQDSLTPLSSGYFAPRWHNIGLCTDLRKSLADILSFAPAYTNLDDTWRRSRQLQSFQDA
jgi:hypothetical protein